MVRCFFADRGGGGGGGGVDGGLLQVVSGGGGSGGGGGAGSGGAGATGVFTWTETKVSVIHRDDPALRRTKRYIYMTG